MKEKDGTTAQDMFNKVAQPVREPWGWIKKRRKAAKSPHWNVNLQFLWKAATRARKRAKRSLMKTEWEEFKSKHKKFRKGKRRKRRLFAKRTEGKPRSTHNRNEMSEAIKKEKQRREERERAQ